MPVTTNSILGILPVLDDYVIGGAHPDEGCVTDPFGVYCTYKTCSALKKSVILAHEACHWCALKDFGIACPLAYLGTWGTEPDACHGNDRPVVPMF